MLPLPSQIAKSHEALYAAFYSQVNPAESIFVSTDKAAAFLKRSGLPNAILAKIWHLSDPLKRGLLTKQGIYAALKLIALQQNGKDLTLKNLDLDIPPPRMDAESSRNTPVVDWSIKPFEMKKYEEMFHAMGPINGKLSGNEVRPVMMKSKLSRIILGKIWALSDTDVDGFLNKEEFIIAMHLVDKASKKVLVPRELPSELLSILNGEHSVSEMSQEVERSSTPLSQVINHSSTNTSSPQSEELIAKASHIFSKTLLEKVVAEHPSQFTSLNDLCEAVLEFSEGSSGDDTVDANSGKRPGTNRGENKLTTAKEALLCKICMDVEMGVVFQPCGHLIACTKCAQMIYKCPTCRQPITSKVRTYVG